MSANLMNLARSGGKFLKLFGDRKMMKLLPYDAEVEWLQAVRGNYINTGIVLGNNRTFRISATAMTKGLIVSEMPIASCWTSGTNWFNLFFGGSAGALSLSMYAGQDIGHLRPRTQILANTMYHISCGMDAEGLYGLKGKRFMETDSSGFTTTVNLATYPYNGQEVLILARGDRDNEYSAYVQSVKLEIGSDVVFDGIAVRKDDVGYFYDRVSSELFGNAGTGEFLIGPDKTI